MIHMGINDRGNKKWVAMLPEQEEKLMKLYQAQNNVRSPI
jgi:hypothetical protein